ncbi:LOW QUALITY PROTEIN: kinesin-like protein KIN-14P [Hibiscus syriacus]|uniref:LOW QUALITY PROTEIN: kinesin-like protein KIN-14P n=1 Tax=Hibiscus syriacus TaxID=106335 RepID=UPI00192134BE|nr:LOW QUALITY PROTEIN: kinesin-like protein KIN-14P [Hibiscus syriacus]
MANNNPENLSAQLPNKKNNNNSYIIKTGSIHGDAPTRGPLTPLSGEDRRKAASLNLKINKQSTTGLPHGGQKFYEVFQWKQGRYADLPAAKISEMMKSSNLDNAPTQSLLSVVNGILDETFERTNGKIPHRVACLLRKVVQEIERSISTQADHLRTKNNLFKIREEKYQSRIRVLEALAAYSGEETKPVTNHPQQTKTENCKVEEKRKVENSKVEEKRKVENSKVEETQKAENSKVEETQKVENSKVEEKLKVEEVREDKRELVKETDKYINEIASLKQELEMAKTMHEKRCLEMDKETEGVKAGLQGRLKELESLLADSNNRVKELEITTESKCQKWNMKVKIYQSHMDSQFSTTQELRFTSDAIKQELLKTQKSYFEEFNQLEKKLKALADVAGNYRKLLAENRKLFNELQDLKGNIRVFCRIRPFLPGQSGNKTIVDSIGDNGQLVISNPSKPGKEGNKTFKFNKVFCPTATQAEVFSDIQPFIQSVVDGYNVCIFAYGQTGSGKTYTMTGPNNATEEDWGVNYRALNSLFKISQSRRTTIEYEVGVQMIEIYNDQVRDLLIAKGSGKKMGVTSISQPNGLAVPDASMHPVLSTSDVIDLIDVGLKNITVSATAINERSSRSHSIVTVHVRAKDLKLGNCLYGNLHLVDLAGSERVDRSEVTGSALKEAQHINKSLSALGDVIFSLAQKGAYVPYRNSKLTQVLQSSLGGQAKTLMFVQLNPDINSYTESLSTLKFAERVSGVELGSARSSKEGKEVRELMEQMAALKDTVAKKNEEIERLHLLKDLKSGYTGNNGELHRTVSLSDKQSEVESQQSTDDEKSEISDAGLSLVTETEGSAEYPRSPEGSTPGRSRVASKIRLLQKPPTPQPAPRPDSAMGVPGIKKSLSSSAIKPPPIRKKV